MGPARRLEVEHEAVHHQRLAAACRPEQSLCRRRQTTQGEGSGPHTLRASRECAGRRRQCRHGPQERGDGAKEGQAGQDWKHVDVAVVTLVDQSHNAR